MTLTIYRESRSFLLKPETLARHLRIAGLVVFTSGRTRQRAVASDVAQLVLPEIVAHRIETRSPNECMCVFDEDRFTLSEVLQLASDADCEYEKRSNAGLSDNC